MGSEFDAYPLPERQLDVSPPPTFYPLDEQVVAPRPSLEELNNEVEVAAGDDGYEDCSLPWCAPRQAQLQHAEF